MTRTHWAAVTAVVLALLFAGAATVASAGGSAPAAGTPSSASADAGFARDMSVHHQQAVEMSFVVRDRTEDEEVRRLAYDIANTQANQRGMMLGWLDLWGLPKVVAGSEPMAWMHEDGAASGHAGHGAADDAGDGPLMPGMATRSEMAKLAGLSGKEAEIYYLQLMITHHNGGVAMAEGCVRLCEVGTERSLAQGMVDAQRSEVELMVGLLKKRGAQPLV
ncbi:DUF305 domain-containing protein [Streptomyces sp. t39]|uniref:DUF305 domain-containing protein n=1 Tax=Streptomyces sp. t39 TaxID=1828156 RepID=UPI0011CE433A|nr:DUF305 domain-containing protein [Streptomyces sp. t39]TXS51648.1 DUF305 domain-containing protein [Streptomyces sp. t39]